MIRFNLDFFLGLLRNALWHNAESFPENTPLQNFLCIMEKSEEQTVSGLIFDSVFRNDIKIAQELFFEAIGAYEQIKQVNRSVNREIVRFARKMEESSLDYIVVKGQTIATLYPEPYTRMPGDIDFLIQKIEGINNVFPEVPFPHLMVEKEFGFEWNGVSYELHTRLRGWAKIKHQKIWDELMEKEWLSRYYIDIDGKQVRTLSPTMNAIYVFVHLFFHFLREGISLRQFCDWAMLLHHYRDNIDRTQLKQTLEKLDIIDAYCAFGTILVYDLGLNKAEFPVLFNNKHRAWKNKILKDIFDGGNFGKLRHKAHMPLMFKCETMFLAIRSTFRYYRLCPSEVGGMVPRLVKGNLRLLLKGRTNRFKVIDYKV